MLHYILCCAQRGVTGEQGLQRVGKGSSLASESHPQMVCAGEKRHWEGGRVQGPLTHHCSM